MPASTTADPSAAPVDSGVGCHRPAEQPAPGADVPAAARHPGPDGQGHHRRRRDEDAGPLLLVLVFGAIGWVLAPTWGPVLVLAGIAGTRPGPRHRLQEDDQRAAHRDLRRDRGLAGRCVSQIYAVTFDEPGTPAFQGIVAQAVMATLSVFAGMLLAYKTGLIKVTEKFRRIVTMAIIGYAIFALDQPRLRAHRHQHHLRHRRHEWPRDRHLAVRHRPGLVLARPGLRLDRRAIASGAPQKYSWLLAHGLIVTLVWLYLEILRLLGRLRSE